MIHKIAFVIDVLLLAYAFGATVWFFFVQTPALLKSMKKEKFVPLQMRLTRVLFGSLAIAVPAMFAATLVHGHEALWLHIVTAGLAMGGALGNNFFAVPRALRAGGKALREHSGEDSTVGDFASRGAGEPSKVWHRVVVAFVVVMLAGLVSHGYVLMSHAGAGGLHGHEVAQRVPVTVAHHHGPSHHAHSAHAPRTNEPSRKWKADDSTTAHIRTMKTTVATALESRDHEIGPQLTATFGQIFQDCTMEGEAHERLHDYLLPISEHIRVISDGSPHEREEALTALDEHLAAYGETFY